MKKRMVLRGVRFNDPGDEQVTTPPATNSETPPEAEEIAAPPAEEEAGTEQGL